MKFGIAYPAFFHSFVPFFPDLAILNKQKVKDYDLIIFSGGSDISPSIYGEENTNSTTHPQRDQIELIILEEAIKLNKKILGVCRGHQLINAYLGGKLIQDLYSIKEEHRSVHRLDFTTNESIIKTFFSWGVNSLHHQGVVKEGKGLTVTSTYKGVIELQNQIK